MRNTKVVAQFLAISRYILGETDENRENVPNSRKPSCDSRRKTSAYTSEYQFGMQAFKRELREDSLAHGNCVITRDSAYQVRRIEACHRATWVLQYVQ